MNRLMLLVVLLVAWLFALGDRPTVAAEPSIGFDIRTEDGKVLIAADQIRSYEWATHTMTLAPKARGELFARLRGRIASGVSFSVTVNGEVVYKGTFITKFSSESFSTPVVVLAARHLDPKLRQDKLRIQLGYPTAEFFKGEDPRADRRIREALKAGDKLSEAELSHAEWLAKALGEMATIKAGMTREDLLEVFQEEGGLSTRTQRRYVYRGCLYIKVDVTFEPVGVPADKLAESPKDKIVTISKPFLEWPIID